MCIRLLRLLGLQEQLLSTSGAARGVELVESSLSAGTSCSGALHVKVVEGRCLDYVISALMLVAIAVPSITVVVVVATEWQTAPSQRGWLILGFGFYIVASLRYLGSLLMKYCEQILYLRVEVRRFAAHTLFEAITDAVALEAEKMGGTCSFDQEAVQEHDKLTGKMAVKFRFWGSQTRKVEVAIGKQSEEHELLCEQLKIHVTFQPGEDVVFGRDSRLERREVLVLWARTSPSQVLTDKNTLIQWMEGAYEAFTKPVKDVVNIYALQESSADWVPEWKFERVKPCKNASSTGQGFFLERDSLGKVLADAKLWSKSALRVYMITGPPGVGKSEFTVWIAGQLGLPVYRLSLSSAKLTDERLAQLLSQSSVTSNSVLVQVDEFQETVQRWMRGASVGVTPGGFCEVLQGSTAMSNGVVILTGTGHIAEDYVKCKLPAVFRRINCIAELTWMSRDDIGCYFKQFLARFIPPGCSVGEWSQWEALFLEGNCWSGRRPISIDMLKQFLMHQITESSCRGHGDLVDAGAGSDSAVFQVSPEQRPAFFTLVCNAQAAQSFLDCYAPVHFESHLEADVCANRMI
jgi:hypothetical protein